ncbi:methyltransferase domain-containing protein [Ciceribacter azotifigens]|uniref:class I SAM-dependent DNA methyltransferase n=1 Tax=Ciceribacter azotifigens TaxID=2069303 RepID=UPI003A83FB9F
MQQIQFSSGNLTVDRRADYAKMLSEGGDAAAAAELMEQALELAPDWPAGWLRLAEYSEKAGKIEAAIAALRRVVILDPQDMFAARLKLAVLGAESMPEQPSSRYVEALFDDYADRFETSLVEKLGYSVPGKLAALISETAGERRFRLAVDLGCGTGLFGVEIRDQAERLEGFDLSANMLAKASAKQIYDHLGEADLSLPAERSGLFAEGQPGGRADLVAAADVLMYLGSLDNAFVVAAALAGPGAIFAFSVEEAEVGQGFELAPSLRYRHSESYVRQSLADAGFDTSQVTRSVIRMDSGKPVHGILFLAERLA